MINKKLKKYIEKNILPLYDNNYIGDGRDRIDYVIKRSHQIIDENKLDIDENILYTAICYHDIRKDNDELRHELTSAEIMYNDEFLHSFFNEKERLLIKEAIEDQRAKLEGVPRNIYGKLLSSASRNSTIKQCLERSYNYGKKKNPTATDEELFEGAYNALLSKFGENGYAKFYFKDSKYEKFLQDIRKLLSDKDKFIKKQRQYILKLNKNNNDNYFMNYAIKVSTEANCIKDKVGAILVKEGKIIATGVNSVPDGIKPCTEKTCIRKKLNLKSGENQELCFVVHAEQNALIDALKNKKNVANSTLYVTKQPCIICAKMLINAGIKKIVYLKAYPDKYSESLLKEAGIEINKFEGDLENGENGIRS